MMYTNSLFNGEKVHSTKSKSSEQVPYGITMVKAYGAGDYVAGSGISVCLIDTGYDVTQPDLPDATGTGDMCCFFKDCSCDWDDPYVSHG